MKRRLSLVLAMALVLSMVLPSMAMAADASENVISNILKAEFTVKGIEEGVAEVKDYNGLIAAIESNEVNEIKLIEDIDSTKTITISRPNVTIDGNGKSITFEELGNGADGLLITDSNVRVKDLIVNAGVENPGGPWQGIYAIQVYNTEDVVLENVTATGANGGILVNGSSVRLEGEIDVAGNGYGGIEVSADTVGAGNLKLIVNATINNNTEEAGKPTIWEDKVSGCVKGIDNYHSIRVYNNYEEDKEIQEQVHYYLNKENSRFIELEWVGELEETTDSPFVVKVRAEKKVKNVAIPNTLYIVRVVEGEKDGIKEVYELDGDQRGQDLGVGNGYWYWGDGNDGFTFYFDEATTTFVVEADPGEYKVEIYAIQLGK